MLENFGDTLGEKVMGVIIVEIIPTFENPPKI